MKRFIPQIFLVGFLLLAACAPVDESLPAEIDAENSPLPTHTLANPESEANPEFEASAISPTTATLQTTSINFDPTTTALTSEGLPVGFTIEGYPTLGNPNAPIVMEEFSDYQCPFCARFFSQTLPSLLLNQIKTGQLVIVFRDFPLESIHPLARPAALAARCVGEEGAAAYWEMHNLLFENLDVWSNGDYESAFTEYAQQAGADGEAFKECVESGRYDEAVQADLDAGIERGVGSTPTFFINNQPLVGAMPLSIFNQALANVQLGELVANAIPTPVPTPLPIAPTPATVSSDFAFALGNPDAKVTIVEFTDYQCPYCNQFAINTLPNLIEEMVETGRVYYIVKDFPLESIHPDARTAHNAARCANEQGAYWEMHDVLFERQAEWSGQSSQVPQILTNMATELGLDKSSFESCLTANKYDVAVQANIQEGAALGLQGTPSFFINGYPLTGARPIEHFQFAVDLAEKGELASAYVPRVQPTPTPAGPVDVPLEGGYAIGDANAPVQIVEYTDYQCPYCYRHHQQTFPLLLENYIETGQVYYVVKDFPLMSIHPQALLASQAAWCAEDQGAYREMAEMLFTNQADWGHEGAAEVFAEYAGTLELDQALFRECLTSSKYEAKVMSNLQEGTGFGVTGTPAFFINGQLLAGAYPYNNFQQILDQLLNN